MAEVPQERVAVTIVGGGPIGLTMGLLLGRFGVPAVILERNATTTDHPKARGCFARTMELFRIWGVDKAIRERGLPDGADHWTVGRTVADLRATRPEIDPQQTPVWKSVVAQDAVEEELLRAVRGYATTQLRFSTECSGFEQDEGGVTAQCLDLSTGSAYSLRSEYLIGLRWRRQPDAQNRRHPHDGHPVHQLHGERLLAGGFERLPRGLRVGRHDSRAARGG